MTAAQWMDQFMRDCRLCGDCVYSSRIDGDLLIW